MARLGASVATMIVVGAVAAAAGCGSNADDNGFGSSGGPGSSGGGPGSSGGGPGSSGFASSTSGNPKDKPPCQGLQCKQTACPGGGTTSLSGKVYDPSGTVPLYNAVVYVPNEKLAPFTEGVTCDKCGTTPSGKPIATALTDAKGNFTLKNVPVGVDVPLVIQIGRWRRQVTVPGMSVEKCADRPVEAALTRLPRNKAEGDIPKIAITTGGADSLECFLRKLGLEDGEFTNPNGTGRVHLYQGKNNEQGAIDGSRLNNQTPAATTFWNDAARMKTYDMVILSCEGSENNANKNAFRSNVKDYLDSGGRVFASHFHYTWFRMGTNPLPQTASWGNANLQNDRDVSVDTSFAKGKAFSEWLTEVNATKAPDTVAMTALRANVTTVPAAGMGPDTSRQWLYAKAGTRTEAKFYSFNAPIGSPPDNQCGRGVYTDIHVSSGDQPGGTFPGNCKTSGLTPQEKALLFLLMDLASCIQDDNKPPEAPPSSPVN